MWPDHRQVLTFSPNSSLPGQLEAATSIIIFTTLSTCFLLPPHVDTRKAERCWVKVVSTQPCRRRKIPGGALNIIVLWNSATGEFLAGIVRVILEVNINRVFFFFFKQNEHVGSILWLSKMILNGKERCSTLETKSWTQLSDWTELNHIAFSLCIRFHVAIML